MKISDLVLFVRIWLLMATLWFFAAAIERFTYPFRYEGEIAAAEVLNPVGDCRGLSAKTRVAWRLAEDKKTIEYKCQASRPWPFYATSSSTEIPQPVLQALAGTKKEVAKVKESKQ